MLSKKALIGVLLAVSLPLQVSRADSFFIAKPFAGTVGIGRIHKIVISRTPVIHGIITLDGDSSEFKISSATKFCGVSGEQLPIEMFKEGANVTITATRGRPGSPENGASLSIRAGIHGPSFNIMPDGSLKRSEYELYLCK